MRKRTPDDSLQIYITKHGRLVLRRPPRTEPTPAQRVCRHEFAEAARTAQGKKMVDSLPPAASAVQVSLRGFHAPGRQPPESGRKRVLKAWLKDRGYAEDEAEVLADLLAD